MRTKNSSFQLEENIPGTFLAQGWLGGILAGFVYTVAVALWDNQTKFIDAVFVAPFFVSFATMLGVSKAVLMWTPYRLAKFQPRPITRVALASVITGLFAFVTGRLYSNDPTNWSAWLVTLVVGGLPTAILVGSKIKPWDLFTFGSIGGERCRSVWGTLATLPLRFLSLLALALWILYFACIFEIVESQPFVFASLMFIVPAAYFLFSAWVTFKSPAKAVLFATGCGINLVVAAIALFSYTTRTQVYRYTQDNLYISATSALFVICWAIFLIARLSVQTDGPLSMLSTDARPLVVPRVEQPDHRCLGSRFMEWQEHHA